MPTKPFQVTLNFTVRTYDIDFVGIVSNIVYVRWLEDLRLQALAKFFPLDTAMQELGIAPVLLRTEIDYKQPVRLFDPLIGTLWAAEIGRVRQVLQAEFTVNGELRAAARQTTCFIDLATGRPQPTPAVLREQAVSQPES
ncbi:MAG: acyl-CoA thioesterase [Anaerolineae bacterium]|nr:acyl-CoA thioesterase [Anaerolineae bacterium]